MLIKNAKAFRKAFINACESIKKDTDSCIEVIAVNPRNHGDYSPAFGYIFCLAARREFAFVGTGDGFGSFKGSMKDIADKVVSDFIAAKCGREKFVIKEVDFMLSGICDFKDLLYDASIGFPELCPNRNIGYNSYGDELLMNLQDVLETQRELENIPTCEDIERAFPTKRVREMVRCTWVCKDPVHCFQYYACPDFEDDDLNEIRQAKPEDVPQLFPDYMDYIYEVNLNNLHAVANIDDENDWLVAEYANEDAYNKAVSNG
jgi:hypothetical protein